MVYSFGTYTRETETTRWSSISFASLRASSTGWTFVRKARPKTPSKSASIFCSIDRSTMVARLGLPRQPLGHALRARSATAAAVSQAAAASEAAGADGTATIVATSITPPRAAAPQRPRACANGSASATAAKTQASTISPGWAAAARPSEPATSNGSRAPAMPSPSGGREPTSGRDAWRIPATTAATRTASPACAARRGPARRVAAASGTSPSAPSGTRSGAERQRTVDEPDQLLRQVGTERGERRRARLDCARRVEHRRLPEGVAAGERLPEHDAHRPDVRGLGRVLTREPLRRDVRERSGHIALRGQRL